MSRQETPTLIVITGPTAVGKTAASVRVARLLGCAVVSADSRQLFREMPVGTAAPTAAEMGNVPHAFIASHSVNETYDAGRYETDALAVLGKLFAEKNVQVLCGGSGLYIDAVCRGFDELPSRDETVREQLQQLYGEGGIEALQQKLKTLDPLHYETMDRQNPHRLLRALEVCIVTGQPYSQQRSGKGKERPFKVVKLGLQMDREELYARINQRVEQMMQDGLVEEAKRLLPYRTHNALQTVGYKELFDYFDGKTDLETATGLIRQHTRNFARRQLTWFRRDKDIRWFDSVDALESWVTENHKRKV